MNRLNESLRLVRVFHDIKPSQLAERAGISKSLISEIESGKSPVTLATLNKYSEFFKIPVSSLMLFHESISSEKPSDKVSGKAADIIIKILQWVEDKEVQP